MLLAGFFSGAILLALEVVWFRFLILFVNAHSLAFAVMLAVVLAGIGIGGILASLWFRVQARPQQNTAAIALLSGTLSVLTYVVFGWLVTPLAHVLQRMDPHVLRVSDSDVSGFIAFRNSLHLYR